MPFPAFFGNNHITRKLLVSFMEFFSGMTVEKYTIGDTGNLVNRKYLSVPVQYAAGDKWLQLLNQRHKHTMNQAAGAGPVELDVVLPRISFILTNLMYDSQRHLNKTNRVTGSSPTNASKIMGYVPVPYNLDIDVTILSRTMDMQFQIIEQILPFFTPSKSIDVQLFDNMPSESINIYIQSVNNDFPDEVTEEEIRVFTSTLSFTMKANYYMPSQEGKIVREVETDVAVDPTFYKFTRFLQTASLDAPVGDYGDRSDKILNPVNTVITEHGDGTHEHP